jgi:hypothetical protein
MPARRRSAASIDHWLRRQRAQTDAVGADERIDSSDGQTNWIKFKIYSIRLSVSNPPPSIM